MGDKDTSMRFGYYKDWHVISEVFKTKEGPQAEQVILLCNKRMAEIKAIMLWNINDAKEPGVKMEIYYFDQATGNERLFLYNEWGNDQPRSFGSVIETTDSAEDGLVENYPPVLKNLGISLTRGDELEGALRIFIEECVVGAKN